MIDHAGPNAPFTLVAGNARCDVWPKAGGSIGRWAVNGQEMLRRTDAAAIDNLGPLDMSSFPLVPYSNRIGFGQFEWEGKPYRVKPNFFPEPHAIHGTGWAVKWHAEQSGPDSILLRHSHCPDSAWPWPFEAEQRLSLSADTLHIHLSARNLAEYPVPLAFGHHPYLDSNGATLVFRAGQIWHSGKDGLPDYAETPNGKFDFSNEALVEDRILDNCYADWDGQAIIRWAQRPLMLQMSANMSAAVVYIPADGDSFCFEPVPHINNALNLTGHRPAMPVVEPGACFDAIIEMKAIPSS